MKNGRKNDFFYLARKFKLENVRKILFFLNFELAGQFKLRQELREIKHGKK